MNGYGLVLGSGTIGGITEIGALKYITEQHIPISSIAGCSGGALYGALWNYFQDWNMVNAIVRIACFKGFTKFLRPSWSLKGISNTEGIKNFFAEHIPLKTRIEDLPIPMAIVSTDLKTHLPCFFTSGNLWEAISASIAIPILFAPQKNGQHTYVDGKLSDPVPLDGVKQPCDQTIAVYASIHDRTEHLSRLETKAMHDLEQATIAINPDISGIDAFAYNRYDELIQRGYLAAQQMFVKEQAVLSLRRAS